MEFLPFIAAPVALVWAVVLCLRGGLLAGSLLVLLVGACFGHPFFRIEGALPLTLDRLLWCVLLGAYGIGRYRGRIRSLAPDRTEAALLLLTLVASLSTFTHDFKLQNYQPLAKLILYHLMPFGIYWVARTMSFSPHAAKATLRVFAWFGAYVAVTAVAERCEWHSFVFPSYIASRDIPEFFGRARGPLLNPSGNGFLLGTCLGAGLVEWPRVGRRGRMLLAAFFVAVMSGTICTMTRCVWIGVIAGLLLMLGMALPRRVTLCLVLGILVLGTAIAATQWERLSAFKRDRDVSAQGTAESVQLRPLLALTAWRMFLERPVFGCGYGQYGEESKPFLVDRDTDLPLKKAWGYEQHNVFLSVLVETGLIGLGLYGLVLWFWAGEAWRLWKRTDLPPDLRNLGLVFLVMGVNYLVNGMFQDMTLMPMIHMILYFGAGLVRNASVFGGTVVRPGGGVGSPAEVY